MDREYIKAKLYDYFCKVAGIVSYTSDRDDENTLEFVKMFHIGRVIFNEYPDPGAELRNEPSKQTIRHDTGSVNENDCVVNRSVMSNGSVITIIVYPVKDYRWSDEEREYVRGLLLIMSTIKSRIRMKEIIDYTVFHELELGFYNPLYMTKMMDMIMDLGIMDQYTIIFINLVNLSGLNMLLGRKETDKVIIKFAGVITDKLESPECLCRMGGDNFCILTRSDKTKELLDILVGIHIDVENADVSVVRLGAYCGVYNCTGKEANYNECLDNAQASMLMVKHARSGQIQYFDRTMMDMMIKTRQIESSFKAAVRNEEFRAYYQPKIDLNTYRLVGAEALCRWIKDGQPVMMPDQFISVLERSKRVCTLDYYILEHVCADLAGWIEKGMEPVRVSSNFSRKHLPNPNFVKEVTEIVDRYNIPHSLIVIEVTETTSAADTRRLSELVDEFAEQGFQVSVDDFGVGYSSMSMIKDIPFSEIKIDKSFLDNADVSERDAIMMKHIISIASDFHMSTIAEGIETVNHIRLLKKYGCFMGQGYYFDKPLPKEDFEKVLISPDYSDKGLEKV